MQALEQELRATNDQYADARAELSQLKIELQRQHERDDEYEAMQHSLDAARDSKSALSDELAAVKDQLSEVVRTLAMKEERISGAQTRLTFSADVSAILVPDRTTFPFMMPNINWI